MKSPETAQREIFRLLWRIMSWHEGTLPMGCVSCGHGRRITVGKGHGGGLCVECLENIEMEEGSDQVEKFEHFKDVKRLEALGFVPVIDDAGDLPQTYKELQEQSRNLKSPKMQWLWGG